MAKFLYLISVAIMALVFMIGVSPLSAQEGEVIQSLKIVGNKRIDESTILYYIKSKPGTVLSKSQIGKDIEQIFSLGQFKDIQVDTQTKLGGLELKFIVDPFEDSRVKAQAAHPNVDVISSVDEIIGQVDAAIVVTSTSYHYEVVAQLLENGIHVFCEKPLTPTYEQSQKLYRLAKMRDVKLYVDDLSLIHI